jgi:hypothetical protein
VIHGDAVTIRRSSMTPELEKAYVDTLTIALRRGYDILSRGGSSRNLTAEQVRPDTSHPFCCL